MTSSSITVQTGTGPVSIASGEYVQWLRRCSAGPTPYGAALFTVLTCLVQPQDVVAPGTCITAGNLSIAGRTVPVPAVAATVLGIGPATLRQALGRPGPGEFLTRLDGYALEVTGRWGATQTWLVAVQALGALGGLGVAPFLRYAGLLPVRERGQVVGGDHGCAFQQVTEVIDRLAVAACRREPQEPARDREQRAA